MLTLILDTIMWFLWYLFSSIISVVELVAQRTGVCDCNHITSFLGMELLSVCLSGWEQMPISSVGLVSVWWAHCLGGLTSGCLLGWTQPHTGTVGKLSVQQAHLQGQHLHIYCGEACLDSRLIQAGKRAWERQDVSFYSPSWVFTLHEDLVTSLILSSILPQSL
jgi:hypothetical protein